jgi:hypothetical protein
VQHFPLCCTRSLHSSATGGREPGAGDAEFAAIEFDFLGGGEVLLGALRFGSGAIMSEGKWGSRVRELRCKDRRLSVC